MTLTDALAHVVLVPSAEMQSALPAMCSSIL